MSAKEAEVPDASKHLTLPLLLHLSMAFTLENQLKAHATKLAAPPSHRINALFQF